MTDLELLKRDIELLGNIRVPAALMEEVSLPIFNVRNDLINLHNSVLQSIVEMKKQKEEESDEEIVKMAPNDEKEVEEDADVQYSEDSPE